MKSHTSAPRIWAASMSDVVRRIKQLIEELAAPLRPQPAPVPIPVRTSPPIVRRRREY